MNEVTRILSVIQAGDPRAAQQLLPLVYNELRRLAARQMAREKPGRTLDATALVHEVWMRLAGGQSFDSRGHFFRAASAAMRRILVDPAHANNADKRGGLSMPQVADALGVSLPTAERWWAFARSWLYTELLEADGEKFRNP